MEATGVFREDLEQITIDRNIAELNDILKKRPTRIADLEVVEAKTDMHQMFGVLHELGSEWARAFLEEAECFGLSPNIVKVYVVGGMLHSEKEFKAKPENRTYSDLDLVFGVDVTSQDPISRRALDALIARRQKKEGGDDAIDEMAQIIAAVVRKEGRNKIKMKLKEIQREGDDSLRSVLYLYLHWRVKMRMCEIARLHGIKDAEHRIDIHSISHCVGLEEKNTFLEGSVWNADEYKLIGIAKR